MTSDDTFLRGIDHKLGRIQAHSSRIEQLLELIQKELCKPPNSFTATTGSSTVLLQSSRYQVSGESTEQPELEPCPFCGGVAEMSLRVSDLYRTRYRYRVDCQNCGGWHDTVEQAVAEWNSRPTPQH